MNVVLAAPNPRISGPLSNLFCLRRDLVVGQKSFFQKMKKNISDQREVSDIFNNYFVNMAKDIGKDSKQYGSDFSTHPSIRNILKNGNGDKIYDF